MTARPAAVEPIVLGASALLPGGSVLAGVHDPRRCEGRPCVMHAPTDHHMRSWPLVWRDDRGLFERLCEHRVGHPDPDQRVYWRETGREADGVHGCDGCCRGFA